MFRYRTIELVTFESAAITYEHLAGPFAECHERFDVASTNAGSTLTHSGTIRLRGGLWTAPLAFGPVKRAFEAHVREHFEAMALEAATW